MFAVALHTLDCRADTGLRTNEAFGFESRDGVTNKRGAQGCRRTIDGVPLWHDTSIIRECTRLWTTDSVIS